MDHRLLNRQLKRHGLSRASPPPTQEVWEQFLEHLNRTYQGMDRDRYLLERSLSISSKEMQQLYNDLQKASESRIAAERNRLRTVISSLGAGLCTLDSEGRLLSINPEGVRLLQWRAADLIGERFFDLACPASNKPYPGGMTTPQEALAAGHAYHMADGTFFRKDGTALPVSYTFNPIMEDGTFRGTVLVFFDITERKQYEAQLVAAKEKAEEMTHLKDTFLANMSHEIRTPLSVIIGFADLLVDEVPETLRESVTFIQEGGHRLFETLTGVLDLARLKAEGFSLHLETIDIRPTLRDTAGLFSSLAQRKMLELRVDVPAVPVYIDADRYELERILSNLLSNAVKFTDAGSVIVRTYTTEATVYIEVEDTGVGIDEAFLPLLFEEFEQESKGLTRTHEGSGLGLAITKRLTWLMKGQIAVRTSKGQGTKFKLSFPRVMPPEKREAFLEGSRSQRVPHAAASRPEGQPGRASAGGTHA